MKIQFAKTQKEVSTADFISLPDGSSRQDYINIEVEIVAKTTGEVIEIIEDEK